jgi:hypothetical protein
VCFSLAHVFSFGKFIKRKKRESFFTVLIIYVSLLMHNDDTDVVYSMDDCNSLFFFLCDIQASGFFLSDKMRERGKQERVVL